MTYTSGDHWYSLVMTPECAIAFYAGGLLILGGLMVLIPRFRIGRIVIATAVAVVFMAFVNQLRLALLAHVFGVYGRDAFEWAHSLGGSTLMVVGLTLSLGIFMVIVLRRSRHRSSDNRGA